MEAEGEGVPERNQIPPFLNALDIAPGAAETSEAGEDWLEEDAACGREFPQADKERRIKTQEAAAQIALAVNFCFVSISPN